MSEMKVPINAKEATIEAVVIRADGTRTNLGVIAEWHRNPLKRMAANIRRKVKN